MHLFYTHGFGGTLAAQPEIEEVFAPLGYEVMRVRVPCDESPVASARRCGPRRHRCPRSSSANSSVASNKAFSRSQ
jgi:hypothetical protein